MTALRKGLNLIDGNVVCQGVAETFGLVCQQNPFSPVLENSSLM